MSQVLELITMDDLYIITSKGPVNRNAFEKWLLDTDRLNWIEDDVQNGEHVQRTGILTSAEYYEQNEHYFTADLEKYINETRFKPRMEKINLSESLKKLIRNGTAANK